MNCKLIQTELFHNLSGALHRLCYLKPILHRGIPSHRINSIFTQTFRQLNCQITIVV